MLNVRGITSNNWETSKGEQNDDWKIDKKTARNRPSINELIEIDLKIKQNDSSFHIIQYSTILFSVSFVLFFL